ncbi:MAG TPA: S41 family peptidase [Verrucomicrobiae bacterium]|nr:S41 family peptidase [Verrucomicrobiae bacterium]
MNTHFRRIFGACLLMACGAVFADTPKTPDFKEVYDLLRTNLGGVDEKALNSAAVQGLLSQLEGRAVLVGTDNDSPTSTNGPSVTSAVYERNYGYLRINKLGPEAERQFRSEYANVATNRLKGIVIDLRYTSGQNYAGAAAIADMFLPNEQPLLDWGDGIRSSTAKSNPINIPVALLVNRKTSGAAEALAGIMHEAQIGLLLGSKTAGQASIAKEFELSNGQHLRVGTTPVKLAQGKFLPASGLAPDIAVDISSEDELAYYGDAFRTVSRSNRIVGAGLSLTNEANLSLTNRTRRRINEAELVRMQREGESLEFATGLPRRDSGSNTPGVQDPVLSRALDLLKGLAVVQQFRPPL